MFQQSYLISLLLLLLALINFIPYIQGKPSDYEVIDSKEKSKNEPPPPVDDNENEINHLTLVMGLEEGSSIESTNQKQMDKFKNYGGNTKPGQQLKNLLFRKKPVFEEILSGNERRIVNAASNVFRLQYGTLPVKGFIDFDDTSSEEALEIQAFELMSTIVARSVRDTLNCAAKPEQERAGEGCPKGKSRGALKFNMMTHSTGRPAAQRKIPTDGNMESIHIWGKGNSSKILFNLIPYELMRGVKQDEKISEKMITAYKEKYGQENFHNIVELQWPEVLKKRLSITNLAAKFSATADKIARIFLGWQEKGDIKLDQTHFIGFSLGAHLAGAVADKIKKDKGITVGRITGLDPLGWGFDKIDGAGVDSSLGLTDDDASLVDIIHTSSADPSFPFIHYGTNENRGKVDFYPNNGRAQYCAPTDGQCHHMYSTVLFTASINEANFNSCKCASWDELISRKCSCSDSVKMGEIVGKCKWRILPNDRLTNEFEARAFGRNFDIGDQFRAGLGLG